MNDLINFFALRPVFTFGGLKIVWYLYLFQILVQLYVSFSEISAVLAQKGITWAAWVPQLLAFRPWDSRASRPCASTLGSSR